MRDEEAQRPPTNSSSSSSSSVKKDYGCGCFEGVFGRGKYKLWVLGAIILLAVWSMFTGTVTLKWSSVNNLKHYSSDELLGSFSSSSSSSSIHADFDVLDVDEREKTVRQMWNSYKHNKMIRLPSFWREAFDAAYQDLTDEAASVRNAALLEIAKMSFHSTDVQDSPLLQSERVSEEARPRTLVGKARKQQ